MKKAATYLLYSIILWLPISCNTDSTKAIETPLLINKTFTLIPQPQQFQKKSSTFIINEETMIIASAECENEGRYLRELIEASSTFQLKIIKALPANPSNYIQLATIKATEKPPSETYSLNIDSLGIVINGSDAAGVFRGIQTLRQMLPAAFHAQEKRAAWGLMGVVIQDQPAFAWRGMLLDCCRHFFPKEVVKKYIDLLAYYKMNTLHWHLTEDQGWRIEIERYPKLTEIGAWRKGEKKRPGISRSSPCATTTAGNGSNGFGQNKEKKCNQ